MRRLTLILLFFLALPTVLAITPLEADTMEARVNIYNTLRFEGSDAVVDEATAKLSWFPREDMLQEVHSIETDPPAKITNDFYTFTWNDPDSSEDITLTAQIKTHNAVVPVYERIPFPLEEIDPAVTRYLGSEEIADQSPEIQRLAQELAAGKNDAYEVVYSIADWTTSNVEYSLQSLGEPAIQSSSEVLASRWGKCDELTALFISLTRAVGIPSRFVAGYSYTDSSLFQRRWGGHGWAEVWLPKVGWIPFDVTYGEYGYLDAGHVKLKTSPDAKETSIDFSATGRDFTLSTEQLSIFITPIDMEDLGESGLEITLDAPYRTVGFGSAVLILATVQNTNSYYVATRLDLARTSSTEMLTENYHNVLLKPRGVRTVPFLVQIDDNLNAGARYEFPFVLYNRLGEEARIDIDVKSSAPRYDESAFAEIIESYTQPQVDLPFTITCEQEQLVYEGSPVMHQCIVYGIIGDNIEICDDVCKRMRLNEGRFDLESEGDTHGVQTKAYTARSSGRSMQFFVTTRTVQETQMAVSMEGPKIVNKGEEFILAVNITSSGSVPNNAKATLLVGRESVTEELGTLGAPAIVEFTIPWNAMRPGENEIVVQVEFEDELGTLREERASINAELAGVNFADRLVFWIDDAGYYLTELFR